MGQSFLTHDEKSSAGSPSPDLLQFNGLSPKFFGSLGSVKETSVSGASSTQSPESDTERNLLGSPSSPQSGEQSYGGGLVPTPILPGQVSRLREKFMDFEKRRKDHHGLRHPELREVSSDFRYRPATTSPFGGFSTLPPHPPRSRSSIHSFHPRRSGRRSEHDFSERFRRQLTLPTTAQERAGLDSELPPQLRRQPPRTRPYVPQPRSVIIRAGYLPVVQTVDVIPRRAGWSSLFPVADEESVSIGEVVRRSNSIPATKKVEDELLLTSPRDERDGRTVTNKGGRTEKVQRKDAETNTSAELLVLPPGTKTSVLLKTATHVDGSQIKKRKRGVRRRISRVFGRLMFGLLELF